MICVVSNVDSYCYLLSCNCRPSQQLQMLMAMAMILRLLLLGVPWEMLIALLGNLRAYDLRAFLFDLFILWSFLWLIFLLWSFRFQSIAEETLTEFLSKATGTAVEWVQMPGMKVERIMLLSEWLIFAFTIDTVLILILRSSSFQCRYYIYFQTLFCQPGPDSVGIFAISQGCNGVAARACGLVSLEPSKVIKKGNNKYWYFSVISVNIN